MSLAGGARESITVASSGRQTFPSDNLGKYACLGSVALDSARESWDERDRWTRSSICKSCYTVHVYSGGNRAQVDLYM